MQNKPYLLLIALGVGILSVGHSQVVYSSLERNELRAWLGSDGRVDNSDSQPWLTYPSLPGEPTLVYDANLYLSGVDPGGNLQTFNLSQGSLVSPLGGRGVWRVTAEQIAAHRADYADNQLIDQPIDEIYGWPAVGNRFFEDYYGFQLPQNIFGLAPFWDANTNGIYEPDLGDFPFLEMRGCNDVVQFIPSEMLWTASSPGNGLTVFTTLFGFDCAETDNPLNRTMLLHLKVVNQYTEPLSDCLVGWYLDPDLGCYEDDYIGVLPERNLLYVYKRDNTGASCGGAAGFGANPPALGIDWLRSPLDEMGQATSLAHVMPIFSANVGNFPSAMRPFANNLELRNYLGGSWRDGSPLTVGGLGYQTGDATNFAFPGLPQQPGGWTEWEAQNPVGDRRIMASVGPFNLLPGAVNEVTMSFTLTPPGAANHLDQVTELVAQSDVVQAYFDNCFAFDAADLPPCTQVLTHTRAVQTPTVDLAVQPNPVLHWAELRSAEPLSGQLTLLDLAGRPLAHWTLAQHTTFSLDLHAWPAGVYLLRYQGHDGATGIQRLVVGR